MKNYTLIISPFPHINAVLTTKQACVIDRPGSSQQERKHLCHLVLFWSCRKMVKYARILHLSQWVLSTTVAEKWNLHLLPSILSAMLPTSAKHFDRAAHAAYFVVEAR